MVVWWWWQVGHRLGLVVSLLHVRQGRWIGMGGSVWVGGVGFCGADFFFVLLVFFGVCPNFMCLWITCG